MENSLLNPASITSKVYDREKLQSLTLTACKKSGYPDLQDKDLVLSENQSQEFILKVYGEEKSFTSFFKSVEELSSALFRPLYPFYDKFRQDIQILLEIQETISRLPDAKGVFFNQDLTHIGELCSKVYRRDINTTSIRKLNPCLDLDALELLEFVNEETDIPENLRQPIIKDLANLSESISFCLWSEQGQPRLDKIKEEIVTESFTKENKETLLTKVYSQRGSKHKPPHKLLANDLVKRFIASYYVPMCFKKMIEILNEVNSGGELKFDSIEERYHFARSFIQIGEMCRSVRYVTEAEKGFVRTLNEIRNYMKNPKNHQNIFVKWIDMNHVKTDFDNVLMKISELENHIQECIDDISTKKDQFNLTNLLSQNLDFLKELEEQLDPKRDPIKSKLNESLDKIKGKLEKESLLVKQEFDPTEYNKLLSSVEDADQKLFKLPIGDLKEIHKYPKQPKNKGEIPPKVKVVLAEIREIKKQNPLTVEREFDPTEYNKLLSNVEDADQKLFKLPIGELEEIRNYLSKPETKSVAQPEVQAVLRQIIKIKQQFPESLEEEIKRLIKNYQNQLEKAPLEYKKKFPKPAKEDIKSYLSQREKETHDGIEDENIQLSKTDLTELYDNFIEESKRLKIFLKVEEEKKKDQENKEKSSKIIRSNAILHSIGILGETARYLIENDEKCRSISQYSLPFLLKDLDKTRNLRNDLMHRILIDRSQDALQVIYRNILPSLPEIEAINRFLNQELIYDKSQIDSLFLLGKDCFLLGKHGDGFSYFEQAMVTAPNNLVNCQKGKINPENGGQAVVGLLDIIGQVVHAYSGMINKIQSQGGGGGEIKGGKRFQELKGACLDFYPELMTFFICANNKPGVGAGIPNSRSVGGITQKDFKTALNPSGGAPPTPKRGGTLPEKVEAIYLFHFAVALIGPNVSGANGVSNNELGENYELVLACLWGAKGLYNKDLRNDGSAEVENRASLGILGRFIEMLYMNSRYQYAAELHAEFSEKLQNIAERENDEFMKLGEYLKSIRFFKKKEKSSGIDCEMFEKNNRLYHARFEISNLQILNKFYTRIGCSKEANINERIAAALIKK